MNELLKLNNYAALALSLVFYFLVGFIQEAEAGDGYSCGSLQGFDYAAEAQAACTNYINGIHWTYPGRHCIPSLAHTFPWNGYIGGLNGHADGTLAICFYWRYPDQCQLESGSQQNIFTDNPAPATICQDNCAWSQGSGVGVCTSAGCLTPYVTSGENCAGGEGTGSGVPDGCTLSDGTVVCDCVANPSAPFCPGGGSNPDDDNCTDHGDGTQSCSSGSPNDSGDPGDGTSSGGDDTSGDPPPDNQGGNNGVGDGDPDTPGDGSGVDDGDPSTDNSSGTGSGDVDGDGTRDIDCDPFSNPDCEFKSQGQASRQCSAPPTCSGEPVLCAILYQEWASMCYEADGEVNGEGQCNTSFSCTGPDLQCAMIKQARDQYCSSLVGDGTQDVDVFNDPDFTRDLKDEAEEVDVAAEFDQAGFLEGGSCPADYALTTGLGTITVPLASICSFASTIRPLIILVSLLVGYIIIGGRK